MLYSVLKAGDFMLTTATKKNKICFLNRHTTEGNDFKIHSHSCYEIIYFLSGGKIIIDGQPYPVTKNSCCIIPPHTVHNEILDIGGEIIFIGFEGKDEPFFSKDRIIKDADDLRPSFDRIMEEYSEQNYGYEAAAEALLELLLITYVRISGKEGRKCKDIDYIKSYIEQYYNQKICFAELAALSGYSYDYFRYVFKQNFGCSPQNYLINIRLERARRLLCTTELSCTEIAYNCGFSTSAQMTSMIKDKFGETPKEIKKHRLI